MRRPLGARPVVVVGAGLAGLTAARVLQARERDVLVLEKSERAGGRLGTRHMDGATLDHGAQFFTARSDEFTSLLHAWRDEGCPIREWAPGFAQASSVQDGPESADTGGDGHPRYVVDGGINALGAHLASAVPVWTSARVSGVAKGPDSWLVDLGERQLEASGLLLTCPVPQSLALLEVGEVALPATVDAQLRDVRYSPCVALLVVCDQPPAVPVPGGVQFAEGPVTWLADNVAKGLSEVPALTVHAGPDWSRQHYDDSDDELAVALLALVEPWMGAARPRDVAVKRWRFSWPEQPLDEPVLTVDGPPPLAFAGDAFGGAKVEGATCSGLVAGRYLAG